MEDRDDIIKLLSESKISVALEKIQGHLDNLSSKDKNEFLMIKKQWNGLKIDFRKGIITHEEYSSRENRIVDSLLQLLESKANEKSKAKKPFKKYQIARTIKYAFSVFGLLTIFFAIFKIVDKIISRKELSSGLMCNIGLEDIEKIRFEPDTIYQYEDLDLDKVSLKINDQVQRSINFSISNKYGEIDIVVMWLELIKMHSCVPADFYLEADYANNDFYLNVVPEIMQYKLMAPTYTNSEDPINLKNEDTNSYYIAIGTDKNASLDVQIKALIHDKQLNMSYTIKSDTFKFYGRKCIEEKEELYKIGSVEQVIPPYLYKLMTNGGFWSNMTEKQDSLNLRALCEISYLTGRNLSELREDIKEDNIYYFTEIKRFPSPYDLVLFEITKRLINKIDWKESKTPAANNAHRQ